MNSTKGHRTSIDKIASHTQLAPQVAQAQALLVIAEILADIADRLEAITDDRAFPDPPLREPNAEPGDKYMRTG